MVKIILGMALLSVLAFSGKITWDENGKPIIEESSKPVKGCNQGGFDSIVEDANKTKGCN